MSRLSLVDNPDDFYYNTHKDHIVPDGGDGIENFALACRACNFIKRKTNFSQGDPSRAAIIDRASAYIEEKRVRNRARAEADLKLMKLLDALETTVVDPPTPLGR